MCFVPQPRAFFRHLNVQKWYENGVFCTFLIRNVLRGTTTYTFSTAELSKSALTLVCLHHFYVQTRAVSTSQFPKVLRTRGVFNVLTSKWACNFLISHLPRWLRTRRFNEPTFQPFGATKYGINTVFGYFFTLSHTLIFFLLTACKHVRVVQKPPSLPIPMATPRGTTESGACLLHIECTRQKLRKLQAIWWVS